MVSSRQPVSPRYRPTCSATAPPAGRTSEQSDPIRPADRGKPLPLSFAQQRLWFIERFESGQSGYTSALALRLGARSR